MSLPISADEVRANYARIQDEVGEGVTVVVATKYVSPEEMEALAEAGVPVVGENRLQDLEAKHARFGESFRWHFIGHLQSRKARDVSALCELVHSLDSLSAAKRLTAPALVEVNLSGEGTKSGVPREDLVAFLDEARGPGSRRSRAHDDAAARGRPRGVPPVLPRAARAGPGALPSGALDGHLAGLPRGRRGGRDARSGGFRAVRTLRFAPVMGVGQVWSRALVYFGIVEEDEYWDEEAYAAEEELERTYDRSDSANVRRLSPRKQRREEFEDWSEPDASVLEHGRHPAGAGRRPLEAVASASVRVHLVVPRSFNDAQSIADKFKESVPVIVNLQGTDSELSKRLIDFSSGLTYALNGSMQRVADKVFLLTPRNVEVSAEERARLIDRGFYNQS